MQHPKRAIASQPHGFARRILTVLSATLVLFRAARNRCRARSPAQPDPLGREPQRLQLDVGGRHPGLPRQATRLAQDLVTPDYEKVITLSRTQTNVSTTPDVGEAPKKASLIIYEACQAWHINPKVMLAMLEKEQSLLSDSAEAGFDHPGSRSRCRLPGEDPLARPRQARLQPGGDQQVSGFRQPDLARGQAARHVRRSEQGLGDRAVHRGDVV